MTNQEAIAEINRRWEILGYCETEELDEALYVAIKALEQQKVGRWISRYHISDPPCNTHFWVCSECRQEYSYDAESGIEMSKYNYCPNCGAKMEDEE